MSDSNDQDHKKVLHLSSAGKPKLEVKKPAADATVRQSFSHGRSKTVTVEVKKKRAVEKGALPGVADGGAAARQAAQGIPLRGQSGRPKPGASSGQRQLTKDERDARLRAVLGAQQEAEQRRAAEEEAAAEAAAAAKLAAEAPPPAPEPEPEPEVLDAETLRRREMEELRAIQEEERRVAAEAEAKRAEEEAKRKAEEEARKAEDARRRPAGGDERSERSASPRGPGANAARIAAEPPTTKAATTLAAKFVPPTEEEDEDRKSVV